ncbi:MAG TPA: hypothetical protein VFA76_04745 [Terriglobales bacterium]|nr:hypothetical protein [Terriglobales bacterium]
MAELATPTQHASGGFANLARVSGAREKAASIASPYRLPAMRFASIIQPANIRPPGTGAEYHHPSAAASIRSAFPASAMGSDKPPIKQSASIRSRFPSLTAGPYRPVATTKKSAFAAHALPSVWRTSNAQ